MIRALILAWLSAVALVCLSPADARASLRLIDLGVLQYAPAGGREGGYGVSVNDYGQVIGQSEASYGADWGQGMWWQPVAAGATAGTLHDIAERVGPTRPTYNGPAFVGMSERGEMLLTTNQLFVPDAPNGLSGRLIPNWYASLPNASGYAAIAGNASLYRIDLAGNGTAVVDGVLAAGAMINAGGQIVAYPAVGASDALLWTPSTPNGTTGNARTLSMPFRRTDETTLLFNDAGQVVRTVAFRGGDMEGRPTAYLYTPGLNGDRPVALDDLLGVPVVQVLDLNDRGQLLVECRQEDDFILGRYLLTPNAAGNFDRLDLMTLLAPQRIDDHTLLARFTPAALNNTGRLVGTAQWSYDNGVTWQFHATAIDVPEPTVLATATLLCATAARRRRRCSSAGSAIA